MASFGAVAMLRSKKFPEFHGMPDSGQRFATRKVRCALARAKDLFLLQNIINRRSGLRATGGPTT
jgi:hypothetical protein